MLVILFNFSNSTSQTYTTTTVDDVNAKVRDFYLENSVSTDSDDLHGDRVAHDKRHEHDV